MHESLLLSEIVTLQRGTTYKSARLGDEGPVLLGLGAINRHGGFRDHSFRTYGGHSPDALLVRPGELFLSLKDVTQTADLLGAVAQVPSKVGVGRLTQDTVRLDIHIEGFSTDYLYWMLRTPQYRSYCRSHATGTTNLGLSREAFFAYRIPLPDLARQGLVELLGALDDKIAANADIVRSAGALATSKFLEARLTSEPAGTFADLSEVGGGGTPSTAEPSYWGGDINWATPTDVTALAGPYLRTTGRQITSVGLEKCASPLYPVGSILMTSRATIGAFAIAEEPTAVNQGFIVVNPRDRALKYWFYHEMVSRVPEFTSLANGATFLELSRGRFKQLSVRLADHDTMESFCLAAEGLHRVASQALAESESLAVVRDALLPHLMSGRLRVRDAEKIVSDRL